MMGASKWPQILKLGHNTQSLWGPDFLILSKFLCHVTLKLAVSLSRPSVPYGANLCFVSSHCFTLWCCLRCKRSRNNNLHSLDLLWPSHSHMCLPVCPDNYLLNYMTFDIAIQHAGSDSKDKVIHYCLVG